MNQLCNASKLTQILQTNGFESGEVTRVNPVSGGSINSAYAVHTRKACFFLKVNRTDAYPHMFESESKGLEWLAEHAQLVVPKPLFIAKHAGFAYFFMQYLTPERSHQNHFEFGVKLAQMHRASSSQFGLNHDNYMGSLPQQNQFADTWVHFFGQNRLEPQVALARDKGAIDAETARRFDAFYKRMPDLFPEEPPALIHGDLWSGNYMFTAGGPAIFDPAVAFAHREQDLAMTKLFGGFSPAFYRGYFEEYPVESGFESRVDAYNLYPILIHVNLFGGGYVGQLKEMLRNYL